eukprot:TRINITY_DN22741_c0_g1_i1.p1 TRINITY_DN22741_c0_g1~~TRINITY_DN22741_c0_g1_i1.p1  ORF type:complete len:515 (-),score=75.28 TRINITY_DN22741_c0_g1_i1:210-1691(-)
MEPAVLGSSRRAARLSGGGGSGGEAFTTAAHDVLSNVATPRPAPTSAPAPTLLARTAPSSGAAGKASLDKKLAGPELSSHGAGYESKQPALAPATVPASCESPGISPTARHAVVAGCLIAGDATPVSEARAGSKRVARAGSKQGGFYFSSPVNISAEEYSLLDSNPESAPATPAAEALSPSAARNASTCEPVAVRARSKQSVTFIAHQDTVREFKRMDSERGSEISSPTSPGAASQVGARTPISRKGSKECAVNMLSRASSKESTAAFIDKFLDEALETVEDKVVTTSLGFLDDDGQQTSRRCTKTVIASTAKPQVDLLTIRQWFNELDRDHAGYVTKQTYSALLRENERFRDFIVYRIQSFVPSATSSSQMAMELRQALRFWKEMDLNKNGRVEWEEFVYFFKRLDIFLEYDDEANPRERIANLLGALHDRGSLTDEESEELRKLSNEHLSHVNMQRRSLQMGAASSQGVGCSPTAHSRSGSKASTFRSCTM